ncbi:Sterol desaturase/sphingolipid hydroxylase, fatty acid hydroxylase superfamily [Filimonas lacunae]|uniref:Sterol desaturase/sphingolipid hydroxylase, fatty acid hydroxylase superfamily n=1 Tax=Filimonas lacunae TaxID=477680 RepID=A0A173MG61_9BACT|nr:sterol desaturase family protein [Filimonas lacunae]BAV06467.1 sterol desaturase-like protein [Filimonas lacunae]SIT27067.1 Sterol desaturase/sphingolipid hydroxylase, fatty acid hydroxylase superfamily [Filimonas lacunae]
MDNILTYLLQLPSGYIWLIFLTENILITFGVLFIGSFFYKGRYSTKDWYLCAVTNVLNTVVTFAGYRLWEHQYIVIDTHFSWWMLPHFIILFLAMDLLMFVFHIIIHKTFLYKAVHMLHHEAVDPSPIDLFVLHPVEALGFGSLWLLLLLIYPFNIYGIIIYLVVNVIFGLIGHLGMEPLPSAMLQWPGIRYLGTSTFHHNHHQDIRYNFGFYTSIWDRIFRTYKQQPPSY